MEKRLLQINRRTLSFITLFAIILLALFKYWVSGWFASTSNDMVVIFGGEVTAFHKSIEQLTNGIWKSHKVGYFIYYPIYISFHLLFIYFLFDNRKVRFWLMTVVVTAIAILITLVFLSSLMEKEVLQYASYKLFSKLFGLPFILLAIEGGRILYKDVQKRTETNPSKTE